MVGVFTDYPGAHSLPLKCILGITLTSM